MKNIELIKDTLYFKKGEKMRVLWKEKDEHGTWYLAETLRNVDRSNQKYEEYISREQFQYID